MNLTLKLKQLGSPSLLCDKSFEAGFDESQGRPKSVEFFSRGGQLRCQVEVVARRGAMPQPLREASVRFKFIPTVERALPLITETSKSQRESGLVLKLCLEGRCSCFPCSVIY